MKRDEMLRFMMFLCCSMFLLPTFASGEDGKAKTPATNFDQDQLVAWCIVPFDAKQRGPKERVEMLTRLGIQRVAYDWRAKHVPTFEDEILQYKEHGIEFFAFWSWHDEFASLVKKHGIHPQFWITVPSPKAESQSERVQLAAEQLCSVATKAGELDCQFGLYNHGGWGGEPENMVAVCRYMRDEMGLKNVGLVYNFHHGHEHIARFESVLKEMKPFLLCLNLNGMADPKTVTGLTNKILTIGDGTHETAMIHAVIESGYTGPIGILDHRNELDTEQSLRENLNGLKQVRGRH